MRIQQTTPKLRQAGFTLIELLLSVGLISILAGLSLPLYASFQNRNTMDVTTESVAQMLRRAQTYSRGVSGDSAWGVEIQSTTATLFKGTNFASRDTAYDETTSIPSTIAVSGLNEVLFAKLSATPNTTGTITLSLDANNTRTITINAKGMVSY